MSAKSAGKKTMKTYVVLLRGVNVGGKGTISMAALKAELEKAGFSDVITYINSGNLILRSGNDAKTAQKAIEKVLQKRFKFDTTLNKVLVLTNVQLASVVKNKPKGFGDDKKTYYSDAIFLVGIKTGQAMAIFSPKEGVDTIWPGTLAIYSQRLGSMRTKSRLNRIMSSPLYKSMTVRTWGTVLKLLEITKK